MRVVFAGTPEFARVALADLLAAGHEVPLVLTQPDRPAGRGMKLRPGPVKALALAQGIPVLQPRSLRLDGRYPEDAQATRDALSAEAPDLMVVAAYGLILPAWVLELPAHGCLNIHASLLPRWRGAAPIHRAIEAGDAATGITIMQMDEGLDTGDILLERSLPITQQHTTASLHDALAALGGRAIVEALEVLQQGRLRRRAQPAEGVTYAAKLDKAEASLDFSLPAAELERRIRAFDPFPGATMKLPGLEQPVKVWKAEVLPARGQQAAGTLLSASADGVDIATGDGVLRVIELQKAGGKRLPVAAFMQGWSAP